MTSALVATAVVVWLVAPVVRQPVHTSVHVPWPALAVLFALAKFAVIRVEFHDESHSLNLSDALLLPAIAFAGPEGAVLAATTGYVVRAVWVHQSIVKAAFNTALHAAVAVVGLAVYHVILGSDAVASLRGWLAGAVTLLVASALTELLIQVVIAVNGGRSASSSFGRLGRALGAQVLVVTVIGLVAARMLAAGITPAVLFTLLAIVIAVGYAAYGRLQTRHERIQQLYRFTKALAEVTDQKDVIVAVLSETLSLLNSRVAQLVVAERDGTGLHVLTLTHGGVVERRAGLHPLAELACDRRTPLLASRVPVPPDDVAAALAQCGFRDAAIVPLSADGDQTELLVVADRQGGDNVTFHDSDIDLLERLATHTSMALLSSRLLEQLRSEIAVKQHQASHDGLTGLANRLLFSTALDQAVAERRDGEVVGVLIMDLDGFKTVNDTMGHDVGDILLQQIADRLQRAVGDDGLIARLGGDEFAVVVPRARGTEEVRQLALGLSAAVQEPVPVAGTEVEMQASIGLTIAPDHGDDRSTLMRRADVAMYQAKRRGDGVAVYDDRPSNTRVGNPSLISALREAIETSGLEMHYQPKADMRTGKVVGVEALLRWTHPAYGEIGPEQAIPVAERSGLIRPLTRWVLDEALGQLAAWRADDVNIDLAVNLSPTLLADPGIADEVSRLLRHHGIPPASLTLELTESLLASRHTDEHGVAERLAYLGVRLSIDDYGIGASSLARLHTLPVRELKIDKSFVTELTNNPTAATIVASTVQLARELGLVVVAEGVETRETWRRLRQLRCDAAQGFLLSRPLPGDDFVDWLRNRGPHFAVESNIIPLDLSSEH